jgi:hypothetical protein
MSSQCLRGPLDGLFLKDKSPPKSIQFVLRDSCLDRPVVAVYTRTPGGDLEWQGTYPQPQPVQVTSSAAGVPYLRVAGPTGQGPEQYRFWCPVQLMQSQKG